MSRAKEELKPINGEAVNIYACGPTVYNLFHIGNARPLCVFDVLRRYLKYRGFKVKYVQNFTDVDDKIIKKAADLGISALEVSENAIKDYFTDSRGLNVADADIHPKVTDCMDIIIGIIKTLIDKGFAYEAGGDVYFETGKFAEYGKLSKMPLDDLRAGASERVSESELKRDPMDFALWKAAKEGEVFWESPFGKGRPGWHIECSAMVREYLGDTIDIHGGGTDLIFPHHENEIAQSEAATGKPLSSIWMHNEMVNVVSSDNSAAKMAKSAGNFFTVRNAAEAYGYEPIRFMLVAAHYRSKLTYSEEVIKSAQASLERLYNCKSATRRILETKTDNVGARIARPIESIIESHKARFIEAMDDDLNTADALAVVFELTREINKALSDEATTKADITSLYGLFNELTGILGLLYCETKEEIPAEILELVEKRTEARKNKDFALADSVRDEIISKGYVIEETRQGTVIKKA